MKYEAPDNRKCLRVTRLISEAQDQGDALTLADRLRVRLHLLLCADCRHFKHNTEALHQIMSAMPTSTRTARLRAATLRPRMPVTHRASQSPETTKGLVTRPFSV